LRKVLAVLFCALLVMLLSPTLGIVVGDKPYNKPPGKPDYPPGKPEQPPPEIATFRIWIGIQGEDVVLMEPDYFEVVTEVDGWYPKEKGKPRSGSWRIPLEGIKDREGAYTMSEDKYCQENDTYLHDLYNNKPAQLGILEHHWNREKDYWVFGINWTSDIDNDGDLDPLLLGGATDNGPEWEGSYDSEQDIWTVTFTTTNADFAVGWCEGFTGCWIYWSGNLEFTVKIQKMPNS
jgi:hypothetical protein